MAGRCPAGTIALPLCPAGGATEASRGRRVARDRSQALTQRGEAPQRLGARFRGVRAAARSGWCNVRAGDKLPPASPRREVVPTGRSSCGRRMGLRWPQRRLSSSGSGSSAWAGSGRRGTSRPWPGWPTGSRCGPSTTRSPAGPRSRRRTWAARAPEGLAALIERPDVDVVYLLTPQWFGLHPIELACARGKPIYCALPLAGDPAALEAVAATVRASGTPFMPELARRFYPATLRLRELLATTLGPPRLILGQDRLFGFDRYGQPGPTTQMAPAPLLIDPGSYLLDWCRCIFQARAAGCARVRERRPAGGRPGGRLREHLAGVRRRRAGTDRHRPLPPPSLGRGPAVPPPAGLPGLRRARGRLAGAARPDPVDRRRGPRTRSGSPWSRPSARCSTTSSTGSSGAPSPWPRRWTTPWPSRAWSTSCERGASQRGSRGERRGHRDEGRRARGGPKHEGRIRPRFPLSGSPLAPRPSPLWRVALPRDRRPGRTAGARPADRCAGAELGDLRRGRLPPGRRRLVAHRPPGADHADGLAADLLEAPAGPGPLAPRPSPAGVIGSTTRSPTRRRCCPWSVWAAPGSGWSRWC